MNHRDVITTGGACVIPTGKEHAGKFMAQTLTFPFETEDEAVELANGTDFGLGAAVWSRDLERANRLASRIEAGMVFINDVVHSDPRAPSAA